LDQGRLELAQKLFKDFEPDWLFDWADHLQPKRFTEPESRFKDSTVEPAHDQDWTAIFLLRKEPSQLHSVHPWHAEVERDHFGSLGEEFLLELIVAGGDDGVETAGRGRVRKEFGQRGFVIDQQQARLRHETRFSPCWGVSSDTSSDKLSQRLFNRDPDKVPI
jgi:hypothetical protein